VGDEQITRRYLDLVDDVRDAVELRERLVRRAFMSFLEDEPLLKRVYMRASGVSLWVLPLARLTGAFAPADPVTGQLQERLKEVADEEDQARRTYPYVVSEFWVESLATGCCERHALDAAVVAGMRRIWELRSAQTRFERLTSPQRFLAVTGVGLGLFATLVPKEAFEALGWTAHSFGVARAVFAIVLLVTALYLAVLTLLVGGWSRDSRLKTRVASTVPSVLTYCEISCARSHCQLTASGTPPPAASHRS
jgi:hypothetical protein